MKVTKVLGTSLFTAFVLMAFVIIGCTEKDDLPPIYPIGSVNIELADSSAEEGYFFKADIEFDINTKVKGLREELEADHNELVMKLNDQISAMSSSDIDENGDSELSVEELADLSESLLEGLNEGLEKPGIVNVLFENASIKKVEAIGMGDEE